MTWLMAAASALVMAWVLAAPMPAQPRLRRLGVTSSTRAPGAPGARVTARWPLLRASGRSARRAEGRRRCLEYVDALAAEISSGQPPVFALDRAAQACGDPDLLRLAQAAVLGADVYAGLRLLATRPGWQALGQVAVCWRVSLGAGSGLADALRRTAVLMRADDDIAREVSAALAAPRATVRMLAALPLVGIAMGGLLGAQPWSVLLGTPYGLASLVVGLLLDAAGVWWVERLARAAEPVAR
jgi:tight adherence protein B